MRILITGANGLLGQKLSQDELQDKLPAAGDVRPGQVGPSKLIAILLHTPEV